MIILTCCITTFLAAYTNMDSESKEIGNQEYMVLFRIHAKRNSIQSWYDCFVLNKIGKTFTVYNNGKNKIWILWGDVQF